MMRQNMFLFLSSVVFIVGMMDQSVICIQESNNNIRIKRQQSTYNSQDGNNFIDSIFQIPISTLTAVGTLIKNTRPIVMRARERIQQQYEQYQQNQNQQASASASRPVRGSYYPYNKRNSKKRRTGIQGRDFDNY